MTNVSDMEKQRIELERYKVDLDRYKVDLDRYKAELDVRKIEVDIWSVGFNGILTFATLGIKSLILINGAAVISLLTFVGNLIQKVKLSSHSLYDSLTSYLLGISMAMICLFLAYIFQIMEVEKKKKSIWPAIIRIIAVIAALVSLGFFIYGSFKATEAFNIIEPIQ
ncbi:MAG: hypothetical protein IPP74_12600 [Alphaproteobacteria bacterium]|nr:hypothetical protein [Alphaproteobacteria bacterium]